MLCDAKGFEKIYIRPGYTDMRKGIDGLKLIIGKDIKLNPYQKNVLFLFCVNIAFTESTRGCGQKVGPEREKYGRI